MASSSNTTLDKNTTAALTYVLGPITGVFFLVTNKEARVRFHAMQSTLVFGGIVVLQALLGATLILAALVPLLSIVGFVLWLVLIYKTWQGEDWEVPMVGQYARKFLKNV